MNSKTAKHRKHLPTEHERAPKVSAEITPCLKGGRMEHKINEEQN